MRMGGSCSRDAPIVIAAAADEEKEEDERRTNMGAGRRLSLQRTQVGVVPAATTNALAAAPLPLQKAGANSDRRRSLQLAGPPKVLLVDSGPASPRATLSAAAFAPLRKTALPTEAPVAGGAAANTSTKPSTKRLTTRAAVAVKAATSAGGGGWGSVG